MAQLFTNLKSNIMKTSEYSFEIKTEVLEIVEAFGLGSFIGLVSFNP